MPYSAPLKAYCWQIVLVTVFITVVLCVLAAFTDTLAFRIIGATSISASAFIFFTRPHGDSANIRCMLVSYGLAILIALVIFYVAHHFNYPWLGVMLPYQYELFAAIVFALTLFCMLLCHLNHPPAAGLGVAIVINTWDLPSLWVIIGAIIALAVLKKGLSPYLKSLV
jgi:hypothetical protein